MTTTTTTANALRSLRLLALSAVVTLPATVTSGCQGDPKPEENAGPPVSIADDDLVDNFEDGDDSILNRGLRNGSWYVYADEMGGGSVTPGVNADVKPVTEGSAKFLKVSGGGFKEYVGFGVPLSKGTNASRPVPYDLSAYKGIAFMAKGSGNLSVAISVADVLPEAEGGTCVEQSMPTCHNVHKKTFRLTNEWEQKRIDFSSLAQDADWGMRVSFNPQKAVALQFDSATPASNFDISIDDIGFYK